MSILDRFLNETSMYRLMVCYLALLFVAAILFSFLKILPFDPIDIASSGIFLLVICYAFNQLLASIFKIRTNFESQIITGLILALIVGPVPLSSNVGFLTLLGVLAMGSKYLLVTRKKHIFNPAALAILLSGILLGTGASWWISSKPMLPIVLLGGLLITKKIQWFHLVIAFLLSYVFCLLLLSNKGLTGKTFQLLLDTFYFSPLLFFSFVMLTEPFTAPSQKNFRVAYGFLAGLIAALAQSLLSAPYAFEISLLSVNIFGRIVQSEGRLAIVLRQKEEIAPRIWRFIFEPERPLLHRAGQYVEASLPHDSMDSRGSRRFFTIASSPSERNITFVVKVTEKPSSFKVALVNLKKGDSIFITNPDGEFVLQANNDPCVFIAGGIGITPFISIIKDLLDKKIQHPAALFYAVSKADEFVFMDIFEEAKKRLGMKIVCVVSREQPKNWQGEVGHIDQDRLKKHLDDFKGRIYYISGPSFMVSAYKKMLSEMGVSQKNIRTDYFPGYSEL